MVAGDRRHRTEALDLLRKGPAVRRRHSRRPIARRGRPRARRRNSRAARLRIAAAAAVFLPSASAVTTPAPSNSAFPSFVHKPVRPAQLLDAVYRALSLQLQREKNALRLRRCSTPILPRAYPMRILLADDNAINQKVGLSVLQKLGYRADVASNGLEVLKALDQKSYDILLLDVQMPEMDGLEAARQICQRWPDAKRPRIIAMTGNALLGDREKCLEAGMDDYIAKPVRVGELQSALERWATRLVKKSDTTFFSRQGITDSLLDQSLLAELRGMPPAGGDNMLNELIDLFLETAPQRIAQINEFLQRPAKNGLSRSRPQKHEPQPRRQPHGRPLPEN